MGWNSWNTFKDQTNEALLRETADAMVQSGMRDAGYQYVNLDDGWALPWRDKGHLVPDPGRFPNGFKALSDYLHSKGLKFGIYEDRGKLTCVGKCPGSYGFETTDAKDFAAWGVDYLKYDNCNPVFTTTQAGDYRRMRDALAATGRPILFSICAWEFKDWMPRTGQLWRTTGDITDSWGAILQIIDLNEQYAQYAGPNHWNDPDMLVVGCSYVPDLQQGRVFDTQSDLVGSQGLSDSENRAHFSMWAMMASPLIAGNDLRSMSAKTKDILLNKEVIAVDQDPLGKQCIEVWKDGNGLDVYSKELSGENSGAVALLNRTENNQNMTAVWKVVGIKSKTAKVRDLWKHADAGSFADRYAADVPAHGVVLLKITGLNKSQ